MQTKGGEGERGGGRVTWISSDHDETLKTSRFPAILIDSSGHSPYCKKWL